MLRRKSLVGLFSIILIALLMSNFVFADLQHIIQNQFLFDDVPESAWYYKDVKSAYQMGLLNGKSATKFAPNDYMTVAEAVKLAACMHKIRSGGGLNFDTNAKPWYKPYVDYAKANNIIKHNFDWNLKINRAGYMEIFAQIISNDEALLNSISEKFIPDVNRLHPNFYAIVKLYQAGIVQGVDAKHNCQPSSYITRSEVSTIVTRIMNKDKRLRIAGTESPLDAKEMKITRQPLDLSADEGSTVELKVDFTGGKEPFSIEWQSKKPGDADFRRDTTIMGYNAFTAHVRVNEALVDYRCVISDATGKTVISDTATVVMRDYPLSITKEPEFRGGKVGDRVDLAVEIQGGEGIPTFYWEASTNSDGPYTEVMRNVGLNTLTLFIPESGNYYRCTVSDTKGRVVQSKPVYVAKTDEDRPAALKIRFQPSDQWGPLGRNVMVGITPDGGQQPYTYLWQYSTDGISDFCDCAALGWNERVMTLATAEKVYYYRCIVKDQFGHTIISRVIKVYALL